MHKDNYSYLTRCGHGVTIQYSENQQKKGGDINSALEKEKPVDRGAAIGSL